MSNPFAQAWMPKIVLASAVTIGAWNGGQSAVIQATTPGAVYTGVAINSGQTRLYAANGAGGRIDVFDSTFAPVTLPAGPFTDPTLPAGLVPFNVENLPRALPDRIASGYNRTRGTRDGGNNLVSDFHH